MFDRAITPSDESRDASPIRNNTPELELHLYESDPNNSSDEESDIDILPDLQETVENVSLNSLVESRCNEFIPIYGQFRNLVLGGLDPSNISPAISQVRVLVDMLSSIESALLRIDLSQYPPL